MGDRVKELSAKLREGSSKLGESMSEKVSVLTEKMSLMGGKMKELFQAPCPADKYVEEATSETLISPDWARNLELCDRINTESVSSHDAVRAIKRRINHKNRTVQFLALSLLETTLKNCERMFADVAQEKVLDDMVRIVDDKMTPASTRDKVLVLIESWGEATEELRYLPVFEETMKELKGRGVCFPNRSSESLAPIFTPPSRLPSSLIRGGGGGGGPSILLGDAVVRDQAREELWKSRQETLSVARNTVELMTSVLATASAEDAFQNELTLNLANSCRESKGQVHRLIDIAGDDEVVMFEALGVHDELQSLLVRYENLVSSWAGAGVGGRGLIGGQLIDDAVAPQVATSTMAPMIDLGGMMGSVEEEESLDKSGEVATPLLRNSGQRGWQAGGAAAAAAGGGGSGVSSPSRTGQTTDEEAMADLDEVIFGRKTRSTGKDESLI